jgi:hypothetical protein
VGEDVGVGEGAVGEGVGVGAGTVGKGVAVRVAPRVEVEAQASQPEPKA